MCVKLKIILLGAAEKCSDIWLIPYLKVPLFYLFFSVTVKEKTDKFFDKALPLPIILRRRNTGFIAEAKLLFIAGKKRRHKRQLHQRPHPGGQDIIISQTNLIKRDVSEFFHPRHRKITLQVENHLHILIENAMKTHPLYPQLLMHPF